MKLSMLIIMSKLKIRSILNCSANFIWECYPIEPKNLLEFLIEMLSIILKKWLRIIYIEYKISKVWPSHNQLSNHIKLSIYCFNGPSTPKIHFKGNHNCWHFVKESWKYASHGLEAQFCNLKQQNCWWLASQCWRRTSAQLNYSI